MFSEKARVYQSETTVLQPFYLASNDYAYLVSTDNPEGKDCILPLEIDTEYYSPSYELNSPHQVRSQTISVQIRHIDAKKGLIYSHRDFDDKKRHKVAIAPLAVKDYLEDLGYVVELSRGHSEDVLSQLPIIQLDLYAFFEVVDLFRIAHNAYRTDIIKLATSPKNHHITMERRIRSFSKFKGKVVDYCNIPWKLSINGYDYRVRLRLYDTGAVHGNTNYANFAKNSGIELAYKDTFKVEEKVRMHEMYRDRPEEFDNYALGDLYNHAALIGNSSKFIEIYNALDLSTGYELPRLTIGSTVRNIIKATINKQLPRMDLVSRDLVNAFCKPGSAEGLEKYKSRTSGLCIKVDGGRCYNNQPTAISIEGSLCDLDISGAYSDSMRQQILPLGLPITIDYNPESAYNICLNLKDFLKRYEKEFVPGLWMARVSVQPEYKLKHPQDFFASWYPPKDLFKLMTDTEVESEGEWWDNIDNIGVVKILNYEITNAALTHDGLQWIRNIASEKQRKELLENLYVTACIYYPKSDQVDSVEELINQHKNWKGRNTCEVKKIKGKTTKIVVEQECHKWYGVKLGDELIDVLVRERKKHPKKSSLNELYKLVINTIYGVMVSPFFNVGNVVAGNNITARVRTLAWCMEKGLNGFQTITDGCCFDINRVVYPNCSNEKRRITGESLTKGVDDYSGINYIYKPIDNLNKIEVKFSRKNNENDQSEIEVELSSQTEIKKLSNTEALEWINSVSMTHLKNLFPGLDVLHKSSYDVFGNERKGLFEFEAKGFYQKARFHGSANYSLQIGDVTLFKFRSYPSKPMWKIGFAEDKLLDLSKSYYPAREFLLSLDNSKAISRSNVFIQQAILKPNEFRRHYEKWEPSGICFGETIEKPRLLKEFSLTQFTYQTYDQYLAWQKEYNVLMRNCGQSYEMFFINEDGTLNFKAMVETINAKIKNGDNNFFDGVDKRKNHLYRRYNDHPEKECLARVKSMLAYRYKLTSSEPLEDISEVLEEVA